jgi:hypothetical protein
MRKCYQFRVTRSGFDDYVIKGFTSKAEATKMMKKYIFHHPTGYRGARSKGFIEEIKPVPRPNTPTRHDYYVATTFKKLKVGQSVRDKWYGKGKVLGVTQRRATIKMDHFSMPWKYDREHVNHFIIINTDRGVA